MLILRILAFLLSGFCPPKYTNDEDENWSIWEEEEDW